MVGNPEITRERQHTAAPDDPSTDIPTLLALPEHTF
jgi:hypothetical protein